jgi:hypothetical protein
VRRHCRISKGETHECGSAIERTGPGAAGAAEASRQLSALPACGQPLFLAGQGPRDEKAAALTGKLGAEISIEEGYRRARPCSAVGNAMLPNQISVEIEGIVAVKA